jgi:hypothetical protein
LNPFSNFKENWGKHKQKFILHAIPKCGTHFIQRVIHLMVPKNIYVAPLSKEHIDIADNNNAILRFFEPYYPFTMAVISSTRHKVIAMVRDPRDALISHVFYMRSFAGKPGYETKRDFFEVGPDFDTLSLEDQITSLIIGDSHARSYINFFKNRLGWSLQPYNLLVKFEDLVGEKGGGSLEQQTQAVLKIANFIQLDLPADHLKYILDNMYVKFGNNSDDSNFERSSVGNWTKYLTEKHKELIKERIGLEMIQMGYETDLNW